MLRRLSLRTKLALLVAVGVLATLGTGVPGIRPRLHAWSATATDRDRIRTAASLGDVLRRIQREANLSVWFLASGESETRAALAHHRPLTDRAARVATDAHARHGSDHDLNPAIDDVGTRWSALRRDRARIDRRVISDDEAARRFDDATAAVTHALDLAARLSTPMEHGRLADDLRALAGVGGLERAAGIEQETLTRVITRARINGDLTRRLQLAAAEQSARQSAVSPAAIAGDQRTARGALARAAAPVVELRAPALRGRVPYQTISTWTRASDQQLDAMQDVRRALTTAATRRAVAYRDAAWNALLRLLALLVGIILAVLVVGVLMDRASRRLDDLSLETDERPALESEPGTADAEVPLHRSEDLLPTATSGRTRDRARRDPPTPSPIAPTAATVPNALPKRTPVSAESDLTVPLPTAPGRGPGPVFELIARFEAGRRRADAVAATAPDESVTSPTDAGDEG